MRNPFTPTSGTTPPLLVGREEPIAEFYESLLDGPGAPGLMTLVTGPRGIGKTAFLNALEDTARQEGWLCIREVAVHHLLDRLNKSVDALYREHAASSMPRITQVTTPIGGVSLSYPTNPAYNLRQQLTRLLDVVEKHDAGVVISVDEVHDGNREELRQLGALTQLLVRENRHFALLLAGLPHAISSLLSDDPLTFLRRAERVTLGAVSLADVKKALAEPINEAGHTISDDALDYAAAPTEGYPFMIQLVGHRIWKRATGDEIDLAAAQAGVRDAKKRLGTLVHEPALDDLSDVDKTFLIHMAADDGPSKTSDIAERMGVKKNYLSMYRKRLIDANMIQPVGYGLVDYKLPSMREYLRQHAAMYMIDAPEFPTDD